MFQELVGVGCQEYCLTTNHEPEEAGAGSNPSQMTGALSFLEGDNQTSRMLTLNV